MTEIYVAFSDSSEATIIAAFSCNQDTETWPYQGVVQSDDARWATYFNGIPDLVRRGLVDPN